MKNTQKYIKKFIIGIISSPKMQIIKYNLAHPILYISTVVRGWVNYIAFKLRSVGILHTFDYLEKYKNIHVGKRCFLIGTGPSLRIEDVNKLSADVVFAVNSLIDSFDQLTFTPTYYGLADRRAVDLFYQKATLTDVNAIFVGDGRLSKNEIYSKNTMRFPDTRRWLMYKRLSVISNKQSLHISNDITKIVYDGGTVLYAMMQIAMYMGIKEIYLIGVDCNYAPGAVNFNEFRPENEIKIGGNEATQIDGYKCLKNYADMHDVRIYNATRGGKLEVFPRVNFDDLF